MRCVNCQNEINVGGMVCPYCHGNPILFGTGPHFPEIQKGGASDTALSIGVLGGIAGIATCLSCPPLGITILGVAAVSTVWGLFFAKD